MPFKEFINKSFLLFTSISLISPVVLNGTAQASHIHYSHSRGIVRVVHHYTHKHTSKKSYSKRHASKIHKGLDGFKTKKQLNRYHSLVKSFNYRNSKIKHQYRFSKRPWLYRKGMLDSLNNVMTKRLNRSPLYAAGFLDGTKAEDAKAGLKDSNAVLRSIYTMDSTMGIGTGSALSQYRQEVMLQK